MSEDVGEDSLPATKDGRRRWRRGYVIACSAAFVAGLVGTVWLGLSPDAAVVGEPTANAGDGAQIIAQHIQTASEQTAPNVPPPEAAEKVIAVSAPSASTGSNGFDPAPDTVVASNALLRADDPAIPETDAPPQPTPAAGAAPQTAEVAATTVSSIASLEVRKDPPADTASGNKANEAISPDSSARSVASESAEPEPAAVPASQRVDTPPQLTEETAATVASIGSVDIEDDPLSDSPARSEESAAEAPENALASQPAPTRKATLDQTREIRGRVTRAQFTTGIRNREPVDRITGVHRKTQSNIDRLYYFTELKALTGRTVTHRWSLDGKPQAEIRFEVRGPSWRVYSSKNLTAAMTGQWQVDVEDASGQILDSASFVLEVGG